MTSHHITSCDPVNQVVPAHQVDGINDPHQVDPVHQVLLFLSILVRVTKTMIIKKAKNKTQNVFLDDALVQSSAGGHRVLCSRWYPHVFAIRVLRCETIDSLQRAGLLEKWLANSDSVDLCVCAMLHVLLYCPHVAYCQKPELRWMTLRNALLPCERRKWQRCKNAFWMKRVAKRCGHC